MKLLYKMLRLCLCLAAGIPTGRSYATIHIVQVGLSGGLSFSPSAFSMPLGDTVRFQWVSGSHTTTSTSVPGGGATWNRNITSGSTTYTYKPAVTGTYNYVCTPHAGMGMTGSFTVTTPLPVKFISFMASPTYRGAVLDWKVGQGEGDHYDHFEIEHSTDGAGFTKIDQVKALPKANGSYQYTDEHWNPSMNYYRLKAVEQNSASTYSIVLAINNNLATEKYVHLMGNPVSGSLPLHIMETKSELKIQVLDITGKALLSKTIAKGFSGVLPLDLRSLAAGQYILQVNGTGTNETTRFTKE